MTELRRCNWCLSTDKMIHYHDTYWGVPLHNDQELFAKLVLDLNQAGLSWATILNKQENFYEAFDNFEIEKIAVYDESEIPATNELSDKMSKDMKKRGFKFTGSTVIYAFLQAVGVINDHADYCYRQVELMD